MSNKSQDLIKQLLEAEKKAEDKISLAKKNRLAKLRQAKEKAEDELKVFKDEQEAKFQSEAGAKAKADPAKELKGATERSVQDVQRDYQNNKAKTVDYVAKKVLDVPIGLTDTQKQLDTDEEFFATTQKACKAKADEWSERSRLRAEELAGINEAVAILTSDDSQATFTEAGTFLQTSQSKDSSEAAYNTLQATAKASGNPKLAALATKAKMSTKGHFDRIIKNIEKMMANLRQEEADDIDKKTWCENEMTSSNNRNEALEADKEDRKSVV